MRMSSVAVVVLCLLMSLAGTSTANVRTLTDGRSFDVAIVEVDLVLVRVLIEFGE